jgi:hypothetical protein
MFKKFTISLILLPILMFLTLGELDNGSAKMRNLVVPGYIDHRDFEKYILKRNPRVNPLFVPQIAKSIVYWSVRRYLDPFTVLGIIAEESSFWKNKKGTSGEIGLMQVSPAHWVHDKKNTKSLVSAGIIKKPTLKNSNPEIELYNVDKTISAGTYILDVNRDSCKIWKRRGQLQAKDFHNINECMIRRYNGGGKERTREYYRKITSSVGDYYYFALSNGLSTVPTLISQR